MVFLPNTSLKMRALSPAIYNCLTWFIINFDWRYLDLDPVVDTVYDNSCLLWLVDVLLVSYIVLYCWYHIIVLYILAEREGFFSFFFYWIISTYYKQQQQTKWKWKYNIKYKHTTTLLLNLMLIKSNMVIKNTITVTTIPDESQY